MRKKRSKIQPISKAKNSKLGYRVMAYFNGKRKPLSKKFNTRKEAVAFKNNADWHGWKELTIRKTRK